MPPPHSPDVVQGQSSGYTSKSMSLEFLSNLYCTGVSKVLMQDVCILANSLAFADICKCNVAITISKMKKAIVMI